MAFSDCPYSLFLLYVACLLTLEGKLLQAEIFACLVPDKHHMLSNYLMNAQINVPTKPGQLRSGKFFPTQMFWVVLSRFAQVQGQLQRNPGKGLWDLIMPVTRYYHTLVILGATQRNYEFLAQQATIVHKSWI